MWLYLRTVPYYALIIRSKWILVFIVVHSAWARHALDIWFVTFNRFSYLLILLDYLSNWKFFFLRLVLLCGITALSTLVLRLPIKYNIIRNLNWVTTRIWIKHFAIVFIDSAIIRFCTFCIKNLWLLCSRRFWYVLKLLLWLSIKILWSVTCTFRLSNLIPFKCLVLPTKLLVSRRHSFFK